MSSQTASPIASEFWLLLKSSPPAQFCYTPQSQREPGFGLSAADMFKTDGLGFEGMNTCSMVKARKHPKVKRRIWFGNRSLCMKKWNEIAVIPFRWIPDCLYALGWKCKHCIRNVTSKSQDSFAVSAFILGHPWLQSCSHPLIYLLFSPAHKNIHDPFESGKQKITKFYGFCFTFHFLYSLSMLKPFFLLITFLIFCSTSLWYLLVCPSYTNKAISIFSP